MKHYIIDEAELALLDFIKSEEWLTYQNRVTQQKAQMQKIEEDVCLFVSWLNTINASDFGDGNDEMGAML